MFPSPSVGALGEECEAMIIVANHSHISWESEHIGQSAVFKNPMEMDDFKISVPTGITVITFDNTMLYDIVPIESLHTPSFFHILLCCIVKLQYITPLT